MISKQNTYLSDLATSVKLRQRLLCDIMAVAVVVLGFKTKP